MVWKHVEWEKVVWGHVEWECGIEQMSLPCSNRALWKETEEREEPRWRYWTTFCKESKNVHTVPTVRSSLWLCTNLFSSTEMQEMLMKRYAVLLKRVCNYLITVWLSFSISLWMKGYTGVLTSISFINIFMTRYQVWMLHTWWVPYNRQPYFCTCNAGYYLRCCRKDWWGM